MKTNAGRWAVALACLAAAMLAGCTEPFPSASYLDQQRFLAVITDPLEAAPGEEVSFSAVIANEDGSLYDGPIAWAVVSMAMMSGQDIDPNDVYLQQPGEAAFVWSVPEAEDLPAKFGPPERDGYLVTVTATAFKNGDPQGEQLSATKLFIISNRPAGERRINPAIASLEVQAGGEALTPDDEGRYETSRSSVTLVAEPETDLGDLTYHWFATDEDFAPQLEHKQKFDPNGRGEYAVYLVLRQSYYFEHDNATSTRVTGADWRRVVVAFTGE